MYQINMIFWYFFESSIKLLGCLSLKIIVIAICETLSSIFTTELSAGERNRFLVKEVGLLTES